MTPNPHALFLQFDSTSELLSGLTDATDKDMVVLQGSEFTG